MYLHKVEIFAPYNLSITKKRSPCLTRLNSKIKIFAKWSFFLGLYCLILYLPTNGYAQDLNFELIKAAQVGDTAAVKTLLNIGADANAKDELTNTAFTFAIQSDKADCVITLLDNGADVNETNYSGYPPLVLATCKCNAVMVKALLEKGANVNGKGPYDWTALMNAVYLNDVEMVKILLAAGADVNSKNYLGRSALLMAESLGYK
jgi:ankyrin repeat protein